MRMSERYNLYHDKLSINDFMIWDFIKSHPTECGKMTINALAKECNVSHMTILRFARKMGFLGYAEMKVNLWQEGKKPAAPASGINRAVTLYNDVIGNIRHRDCSDIFKMMNEAGTIYVYSTGMVQSAVAREMKRLFMEQGCFLYEIRGKTETMQLFDTLRPNDLVFVVSNTGEAQMTLDFVRSFKAGGARVVAFTALSDTSLANISDVNLYVTRQDVDRPGMDAYDSLTAFFILVEMLFIKYCEYEVKERGA